jgi:hypothetical protein
MRIRWSRPQRRAAALVRADLLAAGKDRPQVGKDVVVRHREARPAEVLEVTRSLARFEM